jgi:hypothetical protein
VLDWKDAVADASEWLAAFKSSLFTDTIYVLTPQGKVVDLPRGSTPVDSRTRCTRASASLSRRARRRRDGPAQSHAAKTASASRSSRRRSKARRATG